MVIFDRVSKRYANGYEALNQVSFHIEAGEMAFLTGHSGAGKSTLLKLITMIERPTRGQVIINGKNLGQLSRSNVAQCRRHLGVVFQDHQLLSDRSVFDNVALPLLIAGHLSADIKRRVHAALDKVGLLDKAKLLPVMLSGGEQQRVGIARAVVNKPPLLLADEPTGNLDADLSSGIMDLFEEFSRVGVTILIATHDLSLVARYKHRLITLDHGRVLNSGVSPREPVHG